MPGYMQLSNLDTVVSPQGDVKVVNAADSGDYANPYKYAIAGKVVTVCTPVRVENLKEFLADLYQKVDNINNKHTLIGIVGHGITEDHIITMHIGVTSLRPRIRLYDSKYSDPFKFFSENPPQGFGKIIGMVSGFLKTLNPWQSRVKGITLRQSKILSNDSDTIPYYRLGTQSYFDSVSCGYHTATNLETLSANINADVAQIKKASAQAVKILGARLAASDQPEAQAKAKVKFKDFILKAWQDTFMPLDGEEKRKHLNFGHYFMGWPEEDGSKAAYFLSLGFIINPLVKSLRLVSEFPLNLLSETFSYFKNKLIEWAPQNSLTQTIRSTLLASSIGLQGLFKAMYVGVRVITSPFISSMAASQKAGPGLGFLSLLASGTVYFAFLAGMTLTALPFTLLGLPAAGVMAVGILGVWIAANAMEKKSAGVIWESKIGIVDKPEVLNPPPVPAVLEQKQDVVYPSPISRKPSCDSRSEDGQDDLDSGFTIMK